MVFEALTCRTRWEGVIVSFWVVLFDLLLVVWMLRRPVDWLKYLLLLLILASLPLLWHLLRRTWAAFTLEYWVDRNAVTLSFGSTRQVIPLPSIQRVWTGGTEAIAESTWRQWPMPYLAMVHTIAKAPVQMAATCPLERCLLLETTQGIYAVSPVDPDGFIAALQERYRLGPVVDVAAPPRRRGRLHNIFAGDALGTTLLAAGFVGVLMLFGILMVRYPNLPEALAFNYSSDGLPTVVREKTALFLLPMIGLMAWLANGIWGLWMALRRQKIGAYMLWGGALLVQLCTYMALTSLID
jgi:hypothetical protein